MKIGYSYWGFLGDLKEDREGNVLSTPDGNAAYGGYLISAMQEAGHEVILMQDDRDYPVFLRHGISDFSSFSQHTRFNAYANTDLALSFPPLDLLLLEWRFPIPGRNCEPTGEFHPKTKAAVYVFDEKRHQPDFARQMRLLEHYRGTGTKIVVWDLDYKLTEEVESSWKFDAILETSTSPLRVSMDRTRVEPPVKHSELLQHDMLPCDPKRKLVYVGSRYERDDVIEEWIKPVSEAFPGEVEFWGNWTREDNFKEVQAKWPHVKYCDRITMRDFRKAYGTAVACPLLAKRSYLKNGFITPRIWEAIIFGTLPLGLSDHAGIEQYLPAELIVKSPAELVSQIKWLSECCHSVRDQLRRKVVEKIQFMDAGNFVRKLEELCPQNKEQ